MPSYRVVPVDPEKNHDAVLALWKRNLKDTNNLEEKFRWHFSDNPCGKGQCWLLEADGEPVGTTSLGLRNLSIGDQAVTVGVACDLAVERKHRFLQPALMLQKALLASMRPPMRMVYGLPNPGGSAVLERVGYQQLGRIDRYAKVLRVSPYVRRKANLGFVAPAVGGVLDFGYAAFSAFSERVQGNYLAEVITNFDERFDELWRRARSRYRALAVRDSRFLRWRYQDCPLRQYTTIGLLSPDRSRLTGYLTYYVEDRYASCADIFVDGDVDTIHHLLVRWVQFARRQKYIGVSIRCSADRTLLEALVRLRFSRRSGPDSSRATKRSEQEPSRELLAYADSGARLFDSVNAGHWYFTPGDQPYN